MVIQAKSPYRSGRDKAQKIILEVVQELEVEILEMETDKDHIHILVEVDPSFTKETSLRSFWGDGVY